MTITFYLGKDYIEIHKKFKRIRKYYGDKLQNDSNSDCFRYIVRLLYAEIERANNNDRNIR